MNNFIDTLAHFLKIKRTVILWFPASIFALCISIKHNESILYCTYIVLEILWDNRRLIFSWMFFSFAYLMIMKFIGGVSKNGYTIKHARNMNKLRYELATFNDALVNELMAIRADVVEIKIHQQKLMIPEIGLDNSPIDLQWPTSFTKLFRMYQNYPHAAICNIYENNSNKYGGVIMVFDSSHDLLFESFDVEKFRELNTDKKRKISSGNIVNVYFFDPDYHGDCLYLADMLPAKVISIKNDAIILEIEIHDGDYEGLQGEPTTITREIKLYEYQLHYFKFS